MVFSEPFFLFIFLPVAILLINLSIGLLLDRYRHKAMLAVGIVLNLVLLGFFKYAYFFAENAALAIGYEGSNLFANIVLPIGISFFTFQGISYLVDIWRREIPAEKNLVVFGAYLSFFPQLIAGPIVRFKDVINDYHKPKVTLDNMAHGVSRFAHGLIKKVLTPFTLVLLPCDNCAQ